MPNRSQPATVGPPGNDPARRKPVKNSAFESRGQRVPALSELLENPVFSNVVRLFIIVILSLAGLVWKTEMDHVGKTLDDIKASVNESNRRQWQEVQSIKQEINQVNREVNQVLGRTNEMLFQILERRPGTPDGRDRPPAR
jgi:hypothetical protein